MKTVDEILGRNCRERDFFPAFFKFLRPGRNERSLHLMVPPLPSPPRSSPWTPVVSITREPDPLNVGHMVCRGTVTIYTRPRHYLACAQP